MPKLEKVLQTDLGPLPYVLQRKKMKTIRVKVEGDAVLVSCGLNVPLRTVEAFLLRQVRWIEEAKKRQGEKQKGVMPGQLADGERIHFLGVPYAIQGVPGAREGVKIQDGTLMLYIKSDDPEIRKRVFYKWLKKTAKVVLLERLNAIYPQFSREIGAMPEMALRSMKSRWGSAHVKKRLVTLNTALVLAPVPLIDYVVAHELSHFVHADHSKAYYGVLAAHMPDWKARKTQLNKTYTTGI
jgi:predicted metal-dependent hydrolase